MLVLFWWGLIKRVSSYSLTEDTIYLIATGIVFTLSTIILALKRHNSLRLIMWSTVVCLGAITFVPGITAKKLAEIVQTQRLERLMDELGVRDENGHFAPYDNKKVQGNEDKIYELREAYYYLEQSIGYQEMDEKYQPTHEKNILNYDTYPYNRYGYDSEEYIPY